MRGHMWRGTPQQRYRLEALKLMGFGHARSEMIRSGQQMLFPNNPDFWHDAGAAVPIFITRMAEVGWKRDRNGEYVIPEGFDQQAFMAQQLEREIARGDPVPCSGGERGREEKLWRLKRELAVRQGQGGPPLQYGFAGRGGDGPPPFPGGRGHGRGRGTNTQRGGGLHGQQLAIMPGGPLPPDYPGAEQDPGSMGPPRGSHRGGGHGHGPMPGGRGRGRGRGAPPPPPPGSPFQMQGLDDEYGVEDGDQPYHSHGGEG
ncbi:MAG: hypothetical protein Q9191_003182, partial [Dirinaria sp. TL-2023a]